MVAPLCLIPTAVSELFARISTTGQITLADRFGLMAAAFDESLSVEEREAIDRILQGIRRRRYQVVSDISALG